MVINLIVLGIIFLFFILLSKKLYKNQKIWNVVLYQKGMNISVFDYNKNKYFKRFTPHYQIRTNYHNITGFADPFLFVYNDWLYLFYEEERYNAPAAIFAQRTQDLKKWEKVGEVLKESFHLSFPFVFKSEDEVYMVPETRYKNAVILYKAIDFPNKWKPIELISGDKFTDSSIIQYNELWYLFTTVWYGENNGLRIYYSKNIENGWTEHPLSPVNNNLGFSRCGGAILNIEGKLYRPAQNCSTFYGENVAIYEITELSPTTYREIKRNELIDCKNKWSRFGGHHFNVVEFDGQTLSAMDGIINDNWINNHTRKFFNFWHNKTIQ